MPEVPEKIDSVTSLKNWHCYFDIGEHVVKVTGSNLTGFEYVYLDGELVSKKINWLLCSRHKITLDGQSYTVVVELIQLLVPKVKVKILKNLQTIDEDYVFSFGDSTRRHFIKVLIVLFLIGFGSYFIGKFVGRGLVMLLGS